MNPFLPIKHCVPDGEVRVFGDRCYLYGSYDIPGDVNYCSYSYHAFSANVSDLQHWTDHGEVFASRGSNAQVSWTDERLYAPDVVCKNGRYYLYFCTGDGTEGVACSDWPTGPFTNAKRLMYPAEICNGRPLVKNDPSVFIDEDGSAYLYWGETHLQAAKLKENMCELDATTYTASLIEEKDFWFHEGASMRKFHGKYYLLYCSIVTKRANTLDYAVGDSPLGPFTYCGSIINNSACDPESWNIHGSMAEIGGRYYIFYHRSSECSRFSRRTCVEQIYFDETGRIQPVEMSSAGFCGALDAAQTIPAIAGCELYGGCYHKLEGESAILTNIHTGAYAAYRPVNFDTCMVSAFSVRLRGKSTGALTVRLDDLFGPAVACVEIGNTNERWVDRRVPCEQVRGMHSVYLCVAGATPYAVCDIGCFQFL